MILFTLLSGPATRSYRFLNLPVASSNGTVVILLLLFSWTDECTPVAIVTRKWIFFPDTLRPSSPDTHHLP